MSYKKSINTKQRLEFINKNFYMLGVLATREDNYPNIGLESKSVTRKSVGGDIIFYVKGITTVPDILFELDENSKFDIVDDLFVGFAEKSFGNNIKSQVINSEYKYYKQHKETKSQENLIKDKLKDKILFLQLRIEEDHNEPGKYHKNFYIIDMEDFNGINGFDDISEIYNSEFIPIPGTRLNVRNFEKAILNHKEVTFPDFNIMEYDIDKILVGDYLYYDPENNWINASSNKCSNEKPDNIKKLKLPDGFNNNVLYKYSDHLLFISNKYNIELDKMEANHISSSFADAIEEVDDYQEEKSKEKIQDEDKSEEVNYEDHKEAAFVNMLYQKALEKKLYYNENDLNNLHVSIKTSPLTIISGMSGTGKTKMAQLYAETLGLTLDEEYIIIPISPSYTEPGDVLGYLNTMSGIYTPSETGLVDLLIRAEKNPDKLFMVIFDEMNLSQVEHWFSPFISLLELEGKARKLTLYSENSICHNDYKPKINIGNNVIFVGTVNIDETTKDFSDRLLDRANVITPDKMNFTDIKIALEKDDALQPGDSDNILYKDILDFDELRVEPENPMTVLTKSELSLLDNLHEAMNNVDSQKGVSFRIIKNIASYLMNIPKDFNGNKYISRGEAFDLQIKQRVLTKVKGHQQQYGNLIGELSPNQDISEINNSLIYNILTSSESKEISNFDNSIEELSRKAREMYFNGYST